MNIEQIYDKGLAHGAYAIESDGKVALVDPGRDPKPFIDFAKKHNAQIVAVFETHPHADFASSHLEFQKRFAANIYVNPKVGVAYDHVPMEDGDEVKIGKVTFKAIFTPGHSPDHNTYLLLDEKGKEHAVFTGDSLFVGDVGRPDLREGAGNINMKKEELAAQMYDTVQNIFVPLPNEVYVYPAHGGGSACGKSMSMEETYSTIGKEKERNWAMQAQDKAEFINTLLDGQVNIPKYFPYAVEMNRKGFEPFEESIKKVPRLYTQDSLGDGVLIIDTRKPQSFKKGHMKGAINIPDGEKFEQWLGAIVAPEEAFYLLAESPEKLENMIRKTAKIGYERFIKGALVVDDTFALNEKSQYAEVEVLKNQTTNYTILDIRDDGEVRINKIFKDSIHIPLGQLRERAHELSLEKPVVVHCAGGYRSAIGSSILESVHNDAVEVLDLGDGVKQF